MNVTTIVFDVGETLFDERGLWGRWADWLGASRAEFTAALDDVIARGEHHPRAFETFRPGFDADAATAARLAAGDDPGFHDADLFPDALPCLAALRRRGWRIGIAGNTSVETEHALVRAGVRADFLASSQRWRVAKPSQEFFARVIAEAATPAATIAYVGDRLDNDVLPAIDAGMKGVFLRRGLWAAHQRHWPEAKHASAAIDGLDMLEAVLERMAT